LLTFMMMQVMLVVSSRRKAAAAASSSQCKVDDTQLEFSESMRRTRQAVRAGGWLTRWCGGRAGHSQDKYAVDVLATEIDSLKRTVNEVTESLSTLLALYCSAIIKCCAL